MELTNSELQRGERERERMELAIYVPPELHHQQEQPLEQTNSRTKRKWKKLSLEDYLAFLRSRDHHSLSCHQLKQIIAIHGFKQLRSRKEIEEAMAMIKLMDPVRSTLNENTSSQAFVKLDEAIKDLAVLNWQECSVTSIRSINSVNYFNPMQAPLATIARPTTPKAKKTVPTTSLKSDGGPESVVSDEAGSSFSMAAEGSGNRGKKPLSLKRKRRKNLHSAQETVGN